MQFLDRDIHRASALIIDGNANVRAVMAVQLRDLGVQQVRQLSRVEDARSLLGKTAFDIVLCEMNFEDETMSGQDLLDELRREQLLPFTTVFILISSQATATQVMEALESDIDGYLVKPCSAALLADRLRRARRRKQALKPVYDAIRAGDLSAAAECAERYHLSGQPHADQAGQLAVDLWLRVGQPRRALSTCEAALAAQPQQWAKVAAARCHWAMGEAALARELLDALIQAAPDCADGHELRGRLLAEHGDLEGALGAFREAARLSPGSLPRMQQQGSLAFLLGHGDEAAWQLERSLALGRKSKLFDPLSLIFLGLLRFDRGDRRGLSVLRDELAGLRQADTAAQPERMARFERLLDGLEALMTERNTAALDAARALSNDADGKTAAAAAGKADPADGEADPADGKAAADSAGQAGGEGEGGGGGYDLEAAVLALLLWQRLPGGVVPAKEFDVMLRRLGLRFAVSDAAVEALAAAAGTRASGADLLRDSLATVRGIIAQAEEKLTAGDAAAALELLLREGEQTRNALLPERALALAQARPDLIDRLPDAERWRQRAQSLLQATRRGRHFMAGMRGPARAPGGLTLK